jgi:hypothetical protein
MGVGGGPAGELNAREDTGQTVWEMRGEASGLITSGLKRVKGAT